MLRPQCWPAYALACAALVCLPLSLHAADDWTDDVQAAMKQAAEEKKDLLLDFTGSDWCEWCKRLDEEVFETDEFKADAADKFVLVVLDFPRDESKVSPSVKDQNEKLLEKFAIQGFPTIILADAEGVPYATTGYRMGGGEAYARHLGKLVEKRKTRDAAFAKAKGLEGAERAKALGAALTAVGDDLAMRYYADSVKELVKLDAENATGLKDHFTAHLSVDEVTKSLQEILHAVDPNKIDETFAKIEALEKEYPSRGPLPQMFLEARLGVNLNTARIDDALALLQATIDDEAGTTEFRMNAANVKFQLLQQLNRQEEALAALDAVSALEAKLPEDDRSQLSPLNFQVQRAIVLFRLEKRDEAFALLDKTIEDAPKWMKTGLEELKTQLTAAAEAEAARKKAEEEAKKEAEGEAKDDAEGEMKEDAEEKAVEDAQPEPALPEAPRE